MCPHSKTYISCRHTDIMAYTETRIRNGRKYYYRVISVREKNKIGKRRLYLGADLSPGQLENKEAEADKSLLSGKIKENIEKIRPKIIKVLKKYRVRKAGIFGSFATGKATKKSDIDILVEYPKQGKGTGFGFVRIEQDLESALKKKVDLVTYNSISPYLRKRILHEEIRII